jgi:hypothetical protein
MRQMVLCRQHLNEPQRLQPCLEERADRRGANPAACRAICEQMLFM